MNLFYIVELLAVAFASNLRSEMQIQPVPRQMLARSQLPLFDTRTRTPMRTATRSRTRMHTMTSKYRK
jgi:hypothetical protein